MRRILIFIIGTIFLSGCIVSKTSYRIKSGNIEHEYYSLSYSMRVSNIIYLTKEGIFSVGISRIWYKIRG